MILSCIFRDNRALSRVVKEHARTKAGKERCGY